MFRLQRSRQMASSCSVPDVRRHRTVAATSTTGRQAVTRFRVRVTRTYTIIADNDEEAVDSALEFDGSDVRFAQPEIDVLELDEASKIGAGQPGCSE